MFKSRRALAAKLLLAKRKVRQQAAADQKRGNRPTCGNSVLHAIAAEHAATDDRVIRTVLGGMI